MADPRHVRAALLASALALSLGRCEDRRDWLGSAWGQSSPLPPSSVGDAALPASATCSRDAAADGCENPDPATSAPVPNPSNPTKRASGSGRFVTEVLAEAPPATERFTLQKQVTRTLPGTLGDPLRVLSLLPGVAAPLPGLPIFSVRGASPGTSAYFLDGMRLPQLFHLLVGGGVVHAELVDSVSFYPSGYDARFGRAAGGIVTAETRGARSDGQHFDGTLRLYDVSGLLELKLPQGVRITASGHYGYPGPILNAIDNRITLDYWDYQVRLDWRFLTVQALGAHDTLELGSANADEEPITAQSTRISFHRVQVRVRGNQGPLSGDAALIGGYDDAGDRSGRGVHKLFLNAKAQLSLHVGFLRLLAGLDGEVSRFSAENFDVGLRRLKFVYDLEGPARSIADGSDGKRDELGDIGSDRVGLVGSAYLHGEGTFLDRRVLVAMGARVDAYHAGNVTLLGVDPRMSLRVRPQTWLELSVSGGIYQQPPMFPLLLPGIDTFALQLGLQRATGGSVSQELHLPGGFSTQLSAYYQRFDNFTDLPPLGSRACAAPPPPSLSGAAATLVRVTDGQSYGLETLVRRTGGRISGWVAYTLSRSERRFPCGLRPADYDQTHIVNVVVQARLPWRIDIGARVYFASGRPETIVNNPLERNDVLLDRNNIRLPDFFELDLRIDKYFQFRRHYLALFLEVVNATFSRSVFYLTTPEFVPSATGMASAPPPPQEVGFAWILPSIGLRIGF